MARGAFSVLGYLLAAIVSYNARASINPSVPETPKLEYITQGPHDKEFVYGFGILNTLKNYTDWAVLEEEVVEILERRLEILATEKQLIENYLEDYQESSGKALQLIQDQNFTAAERGKRIGSSALLGHRMTSRYAGRVTNLRKLYNSSAYRNLEMEVNTILDIMSNKASVNFSRTWIGRKEMFMSMQSFLHIQEIYEYLPEEINAMEDQELNIPHCLEVSMFALYRRKYHNSVEWLEHALNLSARNSLAEKRTVFDLIDLSRLVAAQEHNRARKRIITMKDAKIFLNVFQRPLGEFDNPYKRISKRTQVLERYRGHGLGNDTLYDAQFMDLCRGNVSQTAEMQKSLYCYNEQRRHPYLYINPVKVEILSEEPPIFQFYDMIGSERMDRFKNNYRPHVKPLGVVGANGAEDLSQWKTSVVMSLGKDDADSNWIYMLSYIVAGMKSQYMETIQYAEYAVGRFNNHHYDHFGNSPETIDQVTRFGDRQATMLYYLEVPEKGGLTSFCEAGISVRPLKGSAVFWYGMYRNGTVRTDVTHGSCPLLRGHKIGMIDQKNS